MKVAVEFKIDVTKIDKARIHNGKKGKYLTMTSFVDLEVQDQYGNNGMVTHARLDGEEKSPILGNSKVFWRDDELTNLITNSKSPQSPPQASYNPGGVSKPSPTAPPAFDYEDIPY